MYPKNWLPSGAKRKAKRRKLEKNEPKQRNRQSKNEPRARNRSARSNSHRNPPSRKPNRNLLHRWSAKMLNRRRRSGHPSLLQVRHRLRRPKRSRRRNLLKAHLRFSNLQRSQRRRSLRSRLPTKRRRRGPCRSSPINSRRSPSFPTMRFAGTAPPPSAISCFPSPASPARASRPVPRRARSFAASTSTASAFWRTASVPAACRTSAKIISCRSIRWPARRSR